MNPGSLTPSRSNPGVNYVRCEALKTPSIINGVVLRNTLGYSVRSGIFFRIRSSCVCVCVCLGPSSKTGSLTMTSLPRLSICKNGSVPRPWPRSGHSRAQLSSFRLPKRRKAAALSLWIIHLATAFGLNPNGHTVMTVKRFPHDVEEALRQEDDDRAPHVSTIEDA
ncbi:hypothetical protein LX36DRAFT_390449 [Colletotrichum falcatum]|nr:hypothetical protein LX36DRAFT_390449 [Colletotrichum falcatum]